MFAPSTNASHDMIKTLVRYYLEHYHFYRWQLQGFGMLRLYLPNGYRLAVWDSRYRVSGVTEMHSHPWNFDSFIVAGVLEQFRYIPKYVQKEYSGIAAMGIPYSEYPVKQLQDEFIAKNLPTHSAIWMQTGPGGGISDNKQPLWLQQWPRERYKEGETYHQDADEIHLSRPQDGTVTLVKRIPTSHPEHAFTVVEYGKEWVSAEPRDATETEVRNIITRSLERRF